MLRLTHRGVYRRRPDLPAPECDHRLHCTLGTTRFAGVDVGLVECLWCRTLLAVHHGVVIWEVPRPEPILPRWLRDELIAADLAAPLSRAYTHRPLGEGS